MVFRVDQRGGYCRPEVMSEVYATNQPRRPENLNGWPCHKSDQGREEYKIGEAGVSESGMHRCGKEEREADKMPPKEHVPRCAIPRRDVGCVM